MEVSCSFQVPVSCNKVFMVNSNSISCTDPSTDHNYSIPSARPLPHVPSYFEFTVQSLSSGAVIAVGWTVSGFAYHSSLPGWQGKSFGYHSDDGGIFLESGSSKHTFNPYGIGDTVGCGIKNNKIFFTKNGKKFKGVPKPNTLENLYPTVGFSGKGGGEVNWGEKNFVYKGKVKPVPLQNRIVENLVFPNSMLIEGNVASMLSGTKNTITCTNKDPDAHCSVKSNKPICIHAGYTNVYFEITIHDLQKDSVIALGLTTLDFPSFNALPGWVKNSFGYHSDDGCLFSERGDKALLDLSPYGVNDVIGLGIENNKLYFVKNGTRFQSFSTLTQRLFYFTVGMAGPSTWSYNFGSEPFKYKMSSTLFKQAILPSPNNDHSFLTIPQCVWPLMILPYQRNSERQQSWINLLSTCHAVREYLFPTFRYINPYDFYGDVEGYYYERNNWSDDYFIRIYLDNTFESVVKSTSGKKHSKGTWQLKRTILNENAHLITVELLAGSKNEITYQYPRDGSFTSRQQNTYYTKCNQKEYLIELNRFKIERPLVIKCGVGATVVLDSPCCHEAVSGIARSLIQKIPKEHTNYNNILLQFSGLVEQISYDCMENAMAECEIEEQMVKEIVDYSPGLERFLM